VRFISTPQYPRLSVSSMREGHVLLVPVYAMNIDKGVWSKGALEFKCAFNQDSPRSHFRKPGVWKNLVTFPGGPRACIGYQFSLIESIHHLLYLPHISSSEGANHFHPCKIKYLLFALVQKFELVLPVGVIVWRNQEMTQRPFIKGVKRDGLKLQLFVKVHG